MKVGIFFGGPSRQRETSFAIGRTVYDKLDRALFTPVPLFVDSYGQLVRLDWRHLYKRGIRDFFPPAEAYAQSEFDFSIYQESLGPLALEEQEALLHQVGTPLAWEKLPYTIDLAFNALLGPLEDGQQLTERLANWNIACTGSSAKVLRQAGNPEQLAELLTLKACQQPERLMLSVEEWQQQGAASIYQQASEKMGFPLVVKPAREGADGSQSTLSGHEGLEGFELAVNRAFFRELIPVVEWRDREPYERSEYLRLLVDLREGLGFPVRLHYQGESKTFHSPRELLAYMNEQAGDEANSTGVFLLESEHSSGQVLLERAVQGQGFSCTVLQRVDGQSVALMPMPLDESEALNAEGARRVREKCAELFDAMEMRGYAEAEGVLTEDGAIFIAEWRPVLHLVPDNLIFAPAADIALSPTALLTQMVRASIAQLPTAAEVAVPPAIIAELDEVIARHRKKVEKATVLLDRSSLQHARERLSSQHIFELLDAAVAYSPSLALQSGDEANPVFEWAPLTALYGTAAQNEALQPLLQEVREAAAPLTQAFSNQPRFEVGATTMEQWTAQNDVVFIAGEDVPGWLRRRFEELKLAYSGTPPKSAEIAADRYGLVQRLKRRKLPYPIQMLLSRGEYEADPNSFFERVESQLGYPLIGRPTERDKQAAAKVLENRAALEAYTRLMFRPEGEEAAEARHTLGIRPTTDFPRRPRVLFELPVEAKGAAQFMEIRAGMLTHYEADGSLRYELFEPGERLPKTAAEPPRKGAYLSADGRTLSPARFAEQSSVQRKISTQVRRDLERAARVLGLQAYAVIEAFVRVYEDQSVDTIVTGVDTMPSLAAGECLFQQAVYRGYTPETLMRAILVFGQDRQYYNHRPRRPQGRPQRKPQQAPPAAASRPTMPSPSQTTKPTGKQTNRMKEESKPGFKPQSTAAYLKERALAILAAVWAFLKTPFVLRNLLGILLMVIGSVWLVSWSLKLYTKHGESVQIPDYVGMDVRDAARKAEKQDFKIVVIDSFFDSNKRPNVIYQQTPEPLQRAKKGRTIYVSKYRTMADSVTLPTFISASYDFDQYSAKLKRRDIKAVIKERVFARDEPNSIRYLLYNGRKIDNDMLRRGVKVPKGSTLEFVVTERITNDVALPDLVCKTYDAAAFMLSSANLVVKETIGAEGNEQRAYVYRQEPPFEAGKMVAKGSAVTLYLSENRPANCPEENTAPQPETPNPLEEGEEEEF
ncbi:MAG: PASTA domain-containing protein [Bacteroidetes bacterium]|jgi:D-alanine-D-alanine ligase|nr:PASTA domain-containing protein [Bacteroidota bacterium]